jgi:hypothetical protein
VCAENVQLALISLQEDIFDNIDNLFRCHVIISFLLTRFIPFLLDLTKNSYLSEQDNVNMYN